MQNAAETIFANLQRNLRFDPTINAAIFNTMRILKKVNPGDTYLENYLWHYAKRPASFVDTYHVMWIIGACLGPTRIMEIGCRTGISIAQLLSAMVLPKLERVVLLDLFNDGFVTPELVKLNLAALNLSTEKIEFIKGNSRETLPAFIANNPEQKFDYILVDGDHEKAAARQDLETAAKLVDSTGIILFDDIAEDGCNLLDVWESFKATHAEFLYCQSMDGKGVGLGVRR